MDPKVDQMAKQRAIKLKSSNFDDPEIKMADVRKHFGVSFESFQDQFSKF